MEVRTKNILQTYLRRLTNITANNRSILLLRTYGDQLIDLQDLSYLDGENAFDIIRALIARRSRKLCQVLDTRMEENNKLSRRLRLLARADRFLFEESGARDLHVGWPFVRGRFSDGTAVRCPLLFFPVNLIERNNDWIIQPREEAGAMLNKSLLMAYAYYNKVSLDEGLLEASFEEYNIDSTVFRTELYQLLKDKVELHFNPDNFRDELSRFEVLKRDDLEQSFGEGNLKLFPESVLGIFPQAGSRLVPDYMDLIEEEPFDDLETFFANHATGLQERQVVKEEKIYAPFPLDGTQEAAVRAVKEGRSIVVQGPPGTGKSQLIANLIADSIGSGLRILVVCQKRVALDVLNDRLHKIRLDDFVGLVHDHRHDRRSVFDMIARQIDSIEEYKARNRSVDVIFVERRFFQVCRRIDHIVEELEEFRQALFNEDEFGISAKELYLTSDPSSPAITLKQEYQFFDSPQLSSFVTKLKTYVAYANVLDADGYFWKERVSFASFRHADQKDIAAAVSSLTRRQQEIADAVYAIFPVPVNLEDALGLLERKTEADEMLTLFKKQPDAFGCFQAMAEVPDEETSLLWLLNMERVCMNCYDGDGVEETVPSQQLGMIQEVLQRRMKARRSLIRRLHWELFSPHKFLLKRVLVANDLTFNKTGLRTLERRIDNRLNLEHHLTALREKTWLILLPSAYDIDTWKKWFLLQSGVLRAKLFFFSLRQIKDAIIIAEVSCDDFTNRMQALYRAIGTIPDEMQDWQKVLSTYQVRHLIKEPEAAKQYVQLLKRDFDSLFEFDKLKEELAEHERSVIVRLHDHSATWHLETLVTLLQNSIRLAWLDHIETKFPALRIVSTLGVSQLEEELRTLMDEKITLCREILLVRARERIYDEVEYNRLNNRVTYRDLHHQVTKKRKLWPLRRVLTQYGGELARLIPCWMASPESVSALFEMKQDQFDLVVFDEASQCFAERGIPAMYRGKQIVVAGDSRQLRPFDLYQPRWDDGESDLPEVESDSLLELVSRFLPTVHLQGHYRSQSLELIDFSNRNFYSGRLRMLPDRERINDTAPPIGYVVVKGFWEDQTNRKEAEEVVAQVKRLTDEQAAKSIGIVTFNAPQQTLILDLLDEASINREDLFVKNIENVQGDERDIIIFSIGYAPDKNGRFSMRFGSLNVDGGENRLNVAVTRAREKVIIVASILPDQMKVTESKNRGPELLRDYLAFAHRVSEGDFTPFQGPEMGYSQQWYLKARVAAWGEGYREQEIIQSSFPYADIMIRREGAYTGIILTDDEGYHQVNSVKDPYGLIPKLLEKKHWNFQRMYSRNLWLDREKFFTDVARFAHK